MQRHRGEGVKEKEPGPPKSFQVLGGSLPFPSRPRWALRAPMSRVNRTPARPPGTPVLGALGAGRPGAFFLTTLEGPHGP